MELSKACFAKGDLSNPEKPKHVGTVIKVPDITRKKEREFSKVLEPWSSNFSKSQLSLQKVRDFTRALYNDLVPTRKCTADELAWMFLHQTRLYVAEPSIKIPNVAEKRTLLKASTEGFKLAVATGTSIQTNFVLRAAKLYVITSTASPCREAALKIFKARCPLCIPELPPDEDSVQMTFEVRVDDVYGTSRLYAA